MARPLRHGTCAISLEYPARRCSRARSPGGRVRLSNEDRDNLERHLSFARNLHIETRILEGEEAAATLVGFARRNQITQIFLSRPRERSWPLPLLSRDLVHRIVNIAKDMQIVIVAEREPVVCP